MKTYKLIYQLYSIVMWCILFYIFYKELSGEHIDNNDVGAIAFGCANWIMLYIKSSNK